MGGTDGRVLGDWKQALGTMLPWRTLPGWLQEAWSKPSACILFYGVTVFAKTSPVLLGAISFVFRVIL